MQCWIESTTFTDKDLRRHEKIDTSDEEEEEGFDFDDYDDKIDEQLARI